MRIKDSYFSPSRMQYVEIDLRTKTTSEFRAVVLSPLGVPKSQVSLYLVNQISRCSSNRKDVHGEVFKNFVNIRKSLSRNTIHDAPIYILDGVVVAKAPERPRAN